MEKVTKSILITASLLGFLGVVLGAFGAHGLKSILTETQLDSFQTGVRYQFYHALFLLFIANTTFLTSKQVKLIWKLILFGVIFFSGSIYLLNIDEYLIGFNLKFIAFLTPIGGLFLVAAWLYFLLTVIKRSVKS